MPAHPNPYPETTSSLIVVDGYGVSLNISRGHLVIRDGIGQHRREVRDAHNPLMLDFGKNGRMTRSGEHGVSLLGF